MLAGSEKGGEGGRENEIWFSTCELKFLSLDKHR